MRQFSVSTAVLGAALLLLQLTSQSVSAQGANCALCGTANQVVKVKNCGQDQAYASKNFQACCDSAKGDLNTCAIPGRACRSVEFDKPLQCGDSSAEFFDATCNFEAGLLGFTVNLDLITDKGKCCSHCNCHGDPHCVSFSGKKDDLIFCDARVRTAKGCVASKEQCLSNLDFWGNQCEVIDKPFAQYPFTCNFTIPTGKELPVTTMYERDGFSINLEMGYRGVITSVQIRDDNLKKKYTMTQADCRTLTMPWKGEGSEDPNWLPYSWTRTTSKANQEVHWSITNLKSKVNLHLDCVDWGNYGVPHINVNLIETRFSLDQALNGDGFCAKGRLPRGLSTGANTDDILENGCGKGTQEENVVIANNFYKTSKKTLVKSIKRWCNEYIFGKIKKNTGNNTPGKGGRKHGTKGVVQCYQNIVNRFGWPVTFCNAVTMLDKNLPEHCLNNAACSVCVNDIEDFGWEYAIKKYKEAGPTKQIPCTPIEQLPDDLLGCDKGILMQYYDPKQSRWVTKKAIRSSQRLCPSSGTFTQQEYPEFFIHKMRFLQCGASTKDECSGVAETCDADQGFGITLQAKKQATTGKGSIDLLIKENALICNPKMYASPTECLDFEFKECVACGSCK